MRNCEKYSSDESESLCLTFHRDSINLNDTDHNIPYIFSRLTSYIV